MSSVTTRERIAGAVWGTLFADALSMPVHWFYDIPEIDRRFGRVTKYEPVSEPHPKAYLILKKLDDLGITVVGDVILKDKKHLWETPGTHYHHGMQAGENTLNAQCARLVVRGITANGGKYSGDRFLADYVKFMTTVGNCNDPFAESYHRDFFANFARGKAPAECCGEETSSTASVGGLVTIAPVVAASLADGEDACIARALEHLHWTHRAETLDRAATAYVRLLYSQFKGTKPLRDALVEAGTAVGVDVVALAEKGATDDRAVVGGTVSVACDISASFPAVLFLAYKYADNAQAAIEANTNCGGENCHRGSVLGAIVGAAHGPRGFAEHMHTGLVAREEVQKEIDGFLEAVKAE